MKLVYVAGPYRAKTAWEVEQNVRRAEEWCLKIAHYGHAPVCVHTMYRFFHKLKDDQFWIDATLALLQRCDAAIFIDGWKDSEGSLGENKEAHRLKLKIWEWPGDESAYGLWLMGL
jgi:hypothetical protein